MPAKKPTTADTLTLIAERAEALRKAGVIALTVDGFTVQLAPYVADLGSDKAQAAEQYADPLMDGATYAGGRVPGFDRPDAGDD